MNLKINMERSMEGWVEEMEDGEITSQSRKVKEIIPIIKEEIQIVNKFQKVVHSKAIMEIQI